MDLDAGLCGSRMAAQRSSKPAFNRRQQWRGVVAACSYEARKFGVPLPCLCTWPCNCALTPKVISGDMEAYSKHSHLVTEIIADAAPALKKASIDNFISIPRA